MNDIKNLLDAYCKENNLPNPGINMFVFGHNDMVTFAKQYFDKKIDEHLEAERLRLMGSSNK